MDTIRKILQKTKPSITELISCFEDIKENGEVAVIKFDGERVNNGYTVFISFPLSENKGIIRADEETLEDALLKVLKEYVG